MQIRASARPTLLCHQAILPGLPNELAMLILARLPRALHASLRSVSRAWCDALHPSAITPVREAHHILEFWIAITFQNDGLVIYDPTLACLSSRLPCAFSASNRYVRSSLSQSNLAHAKVMGVLGSKILVKKVLWLKGNRPLADVHSFDVISRKMHNEMGPFASEELAAFPDFAILGNYVYMSGYSGKVRRLDLQKKLVETLPKMHVERQSPVCVVLQGRLCVISDWNGKTFSGETWDPRSEGPWTLVPELWPSDIFGGVDYSSMQPKVVVLADTLYAINPGKRTGFPRSKPELMCYNTSTKHWNSLGFLPRGSCKFCASKGAHPYQLLAVGNELWLPLLGHHECHLAEHHKECPVAVFSCVPTSNKCLAWKKSYITFPFGCFPVSFFTVKV